MLGTNIADTARYHYRLVVAANFIFLEPRKMAFIGAEITSEIRPAKFIVESGTTDRSFRHDLKWRRHPVGMREIIFPRLLITRNSQVRHRKPGQTCFRFRTKTRRTFIPYFTA